MIGSGGASEKVERADIPSVAIEMVHQSLYISQMRCLLSEYYGPQRIVGGFADTLSETPQKRTRFTLRTHHKHNIRRANRKINSPSQEKSKNFTEGSVTMAFKKWKRSKRRVPKMEALFWRNAFLVVITCVWWMFFSVYNSKNRGWCNGHILV